MHQYSADFLHPQKRDSLTRRASSPDFYIPTSNGVVTIPPINPAETLLYPLSMDQGYHTGELFNQTMEHFESQGVTVVLVLTTYLGRFKLQVELGAVPENPEAEPHPFKTSDLVNEQINKIEKGWLDLNVHRNPICQRMLKNGKLIITEWKKDWLDKHDSKFLTIFSRVQELYAKGTLVTEATDAAVKKYFDTAMERLRTNAIVQSMRQNQGNQFIIHEYTKPVLEEEAMMALWDFLGYTQMAYPVDYHGNGSTSFYLFKAVQFILSQFADHNEPMKLLNIKLPPQHKEKSTKEKNAGAQPPTSRKGSLDSSMHPSKEKTQKHANSKKLSLKDEVVDQFRSLTLLEDERGHQDELIDQLEHKLAKTKAKRDDLYVEVDFLNNIIYRQIQDHGEKDGHIDTLTAENTQLVTVLQQKDERINTLTAEKDELVTAVQERDERINILTAEKDKLADTLQERERLMQEQMQEFQRDREAMLKKIEALEEKSRQQAHIPEDTRAQPKPLSRIHIPFFPPPTVMRPQSASPHESFPPSIRLKRQTMPDCSSGFDHRLQERPDSPAEVFIPVNKAKRPHTCPDLARNESDIAFKF